MEGELRARGVRVLDVAYDERVRLNPGARTLVRTMAAHGTRCVLVSGVSGGTSSAAGIAVGVASGVAYGLYSILGSIALRRYTPFTVTTWAFAIAALAVTAVSNPGDMLAKIGASGRPAALLALAIAMGVVTAVIPYLLYTIGLKNVEPSRAAILATTEPMMATVLGMIVYREGMTLLSAAGILCILLAIIILNARKTPQS